MIDLQKMSCVIHIHSLDFNHLDKLQPCIIGYESVGPYLGSVLLLVGLCIR